MLKQASAAFLRFRPKPMQPISRLARSQKRSAIVDSQLRLYRALRRGDLAASLSGEDKAHGHQFGSRRRVAPPLSLC
jgi:hypothetical protein